MTPELGKTYTHQRPFACGGTEATLTQVSGDYLYLTCTTCGSKAMTTRQAFPKDFKEADMNAEQRSLELAIESERARLAIAQSSVRNGEKRLADLEGKLRAMTPPFAPGDQATVLVGKAKGSPVTVVAVDKAFGDYVVQATFPRNPERIYTYQATDLEKVVRPVVGSTWDNLQSPRYSAHNTALVTKVDGVGNQVHVKYPDGCTDRFDVGNFLKAFKEAA